MKRVQHPLSLLIALGLAASAHATDPAPVELGSGLQMIPTLKVSYGHDDNLFSQDADEEDSNYTTIAPRLEFVAERGDNAYNFQVGGEHGIYHDSSDDDYTDYDVSAAASIRMAAKHALALSASYLEGHEARGTGSSQGVGEFLDEPTEFNDTRYGGTYTFGSDESKGRFELSADFLDKEFDNFLSINGDREREETRVAAKFYYSMSETADLTFEVADIEFDYDTARRDSDEVEYFIGFEWQLTGKTSGYAKIGRGDKEFDDPGLEDPDSELSWDVGVTWEPREYSAIDLFTSREEEETPSTGAFVDTTIYGVSWDHEWGERWSTLVSYTNMDQEYVGSLQEDETDMFVASVTYAFDRWLDLILTYDYADKSSSIDLLDYEKTKVYLTVDVSL